MLLINLKQKNQITINQFFNPKIVSHILIVLLLTNCTTTKVQRHNKNFIVPLNRTEAQQEYTGVLVVNAKNADTLVAYNHKRYFIPASTTKLFTFYTAATSLPKKLPALAYQLERDTLYIKGTGDPTWRHPYFKDSTAIAFLKPFNTIRIVKEVIDVTPFAPGWAWEDYPYYFSAERSSMPMYGNVVQVFTNAIEKPVIPSLFIDNVTFHTTKNTREQHSNRFYAKNTELKDTLQIPFIVTDSLQIALLQQELPNTNIAYTTKPKKLNAFLSGTPTDSVLKYMLRKSDNFIAEQLMLTSATYQVDTMSFDAIKSYMFKHTLQDIVEEPRWVDGSGLSRYNLFTPTSMVQLLSKMHKEIDSTRLFSLLPLWGANGTISNTAKNRKSNYIYAKSGSMGGVNNLAGYLRTKKGNLLYFSLMNNNFRRPSSAIREEMFLLLERLYATY